MLNITIATSGTNCTRTTCSSRLYHPALRDDCAEFRPADAIDAVYGQMLREALLQGVEAMAYQADVRVTGIRLEKSIPVCV